MSLTRSRAFRWLGECEISVDELLEGKGTANTKTSQMEKILKQLLSDGSVPADEIQSRAESMGISLRTLMIAKKNTGIVSERQGDRWFWRLPTQECKDVSA